MSGLSLRELCLADPTFCERYEGWTVLGRGTYATVVRVRSRDAGREVALKVFQDLAPEMATRVREEVHAAQSLATPYFVQVYSVFNRGPITWFEMELVDGLNLDQELERLRRRHRRASLQRTTEVALAVSRCVWHAHRRGVLHRDVKPANVMLPGSRMPAAKLTDFGIARVGNGSGSTPTGSITGTPRFASPEALAGDPVGPPHDVFGLCTTLYALFSGGRLPFPVASDAGIEALRDVQLRTRPVSLRALVPEIDADVSRLVSLGLEPNAVARPEVGTIVLALEGTHRAAAAVGVNHPSNVRRSAWRFATIGLGLAVLGWWTQMRHQRRSPRVRNLCDIVRQGR
jgi:eukaryotic-like serine/threonine-protein kinase